MAKASREGQTFEKKLAALEQIVGKLEAGETNLEESVKLFERGTTLLKDLSRMLDEAERKVEVLTRGAGQKLSKEPLSEEPED